MKEVDPERWQRVRRVLDELWERSQTERSAYLDHVCGSDRALRTEIESYLAAAERAHPILDVPLEEVAPPPPVEASAAGATEPAAEGTVVGPYRVLRVLGRGGMSVVYLAERADGEFQQQVALKLGGRLSDIDSVRRGFLRERQILANLQHENIARLYDGGVTSDGQPYFAMERVVGEPITTYCDRRCLGVRSRIALFGSVLEAVQYAHRNLVVHRDLKPSNILVTGDGTVKLLDFGIAKIIAEAPAEGTPPPTRWLALTPEYAAPEQVLDGPITTATDVYTLGVVLYELLVGRRPFEFEARSLRELERTTRLMDPERPSLAVSTSPRIRGNERAPSDPTSGDVAAARGTDAERLARELSGDLDNIVLKALRTDPAERYVSVEAFGRDLRRYLQDLPVHARSPTIRYRVVKFVRRNRAGVLVAAGLAALLGAGTATTTWQARVASSEAERARDVLEALVGLFEAFDPDLSGESSPTARRLLDQTTEGLVEELEGQPEVQAEMLMVLGEVYRKLGMSDRALPLVRRSGTIRRALHGPDHIDVAASMNEESRLLYLAGEYEEAERVVREALATRQRRLGDVHADVATSLDNLGEIRRVRGDIAEAETLTRAALQMRLAVLDPGDQAIGWSLNNLAVILREKGQYEEAERLFRVAVEVHQRALGSDHSDVTIAMQNLANTLRLRGQLDDALELQRVVLDRLVRRYGEGHPMAMTGLNNLAGMLLVAGDLDGAEAAFRQVVSLWSERGEERHPNAVSSLNNLAVVLRSRGDYEEAAELSARILEIWREELGPDHPLVALGLNNLAAVHLDRGTPAMARPLLEEASRIVQALPPEHQYRIAVTVSLASLHAVEGRCGEALPLLEGLLSGEERDGSSPRPPDARLVMGECHLQGGRYDVAEPLLREALAIFTGRPAGDARAQRAGEALATLLDRTGRSDEAAVVRTAIPRR